MAASAVLKKVLTAALRCDGPADHHTNQQCSRAYEADQNPVTTLPLRLIANPTPGTILGPRNYLPFLKNWSAAIRCLKAVASGLR